MSNAKKIRDTDSALVVAQLLFLEAEEPSKPIHVYINSPGGSVTAGLAIYDTVSVAICTCFCSNLTHADVDAICVVTHTHVLYRTSMLDGFPTPCRGREG